MSLPTVLKPEVPNIFSLLPTTSRLFSCTNHSRLYPSQIRTLSRKPSATLSPSSLASPIRFSLHRQPQQQYDAVDDDDEDQELVIGDCLVFEEGIFEDPHLQQSFNPYSNTNKVKNIKNSKPKVEIEPENLIPENWKEAQKEINITKKERRKLAQELEFGRKLEKKREGLRSIGINNSPSLNDYVAFRDSKLAELKPLVLDNPSFSSGHDESDREDEKDESEQCEREVGRAVSASRVAPRNPRLAVYGGTLDDVSEFLSSGNYDPDAAKKSEGPQKLFTKEEKVLLNRRVPDLAAATSGKWQPLHTLVASGDFYLVDALLKHNVDINATDKDGLTAIHKAILSKKQAIFNYLLRESANPFVCDKEGATLMHYAVRAASTQMIKILLLYNVDINLQDNDGWTPLHLAVQSRRTDVVRLFLIKGADKTLKNQDGLTPLDLCLYSGRDTRTYELIKLLKELPRSR